MWRTCLAGSEVDLDASAVRVVEEELPGAGRRTAIRCAAKIVRDTASLQSVDEPRQICSPEGYVVDNARPLWDLLPLDHVQDRIAFAVEPDTGNGEVRAQSGRKPRVYS